MKIVCASNMPYAREAFQTLGETLVKDGRSITADDVRDAEILATRSTTLINADLLAGSQVRFVGTATIGTDHMDLDYFERNGITWCYAPGCNANSVSEYITAALLALSARNNMTLAGKTMGIIGVGNVGRRVVRKAEALGMRVLKNDPPRERAERGTENAESFTALSQVLAEADVITMHVPLTRDGSDPTYQMVNRAFFEQMKPGTIFINAARGPVMSTEALLSALDGGIVADTIIDTWEGEPDFSPTLLKRAFIGTPHIAGHSFEGKVMGTVMVYEQACEFLGRAATWKVDDWLPAPDVPEIRLTEADLETRSDEAVLWEVVRRVYDIKADDARLREGMNGDRPTHFDHLRKHYPMRREFRFTRVVGPGSAHPLMSKLEKLGFERSPAKESGMMPA